MSILRSFIYQEQLCQVSTSEDFYKYCFYLTITAWKVSKYGVISGPYLVTFYAERVARIVLECK